MEIGEILSDALGYPLNNIKALVIYLILGIILGIVLVVTLSSVAVGIMAKNTLSVIGFSIIGIILSLILGFVISGYQLDIISLGIEKSSDAPEIDFVGQFFNGIKSFVVAIVYLIIPIIISAILAIIFQHWLSGLISLILTIIFSLALVMAQCRLAKTGDLSDALAIGEAIGDISRVGIVQILVLLILVFVIAFILYFITGLIINWNHYIGGVLIGIVGVYVVFFASRALGLLYSEV